MKTWVYNYQYVKVYENELSFEKKEKWKIERQISIIKFPHFPKYFSHCSIGAGLFILNKNRNFIVCQVLITLPRVSQLSNISPPYPVRKKK